MDIFKIEYIKNFIKDNTLYGVEYINIEDVKDLEIIYNFIKNDVKVINDMSGICYLYYALWNYSKDRNGFFETKKYFKLSIQNGCLIGNYYYALLHKYNKNFTKYIKYSLACKEILTCYKKMIETIILENIEYDKDILLKHIKEIINIDNYGYYLLGIYNLTFNKICNYLNYFLKSQDSPESLIKLYELSKDEKLKNKYLDDAVKLNYSKGYYILGLRFKKKGNIKISKKMFKKSIMIDNYPESLIEIYKITRKIKYLNISINKGSNEGLFIKALKIKNNDNDNYLNLLFRASLNKYQKALEELINYYSLKENFSIVKSLSSFISSPQWCNDSFYDIKLSQLYKKYHNDEDNYKDIINEYLIRAKDRKNISADYYLAINAIENKESNDVINNHFKNSLEKNFKDGIYEYGRWVEETKYNVDINKIYEIGSNLGCKKCCLRYNELNKNKKDNYLTELKRKSENGDINSIITLIEFYKDI